MGTFRKGNIARARLTPTNVLEIRKRASTGEIYRHIGQDYGVTSETIGRIVRGDTWQQYPTVVTEAEHNHLDAAELIADAPISPEMQAAAEASMAKLDQLLAQPEPPRVDAVAEFLRLRGQGKLEIDTAKDMAEQKDSSNEEQNK